MVKGKEGEKAFQKSDGKDSIESKQEVEEEKKRIEGVRKNTKVIIEE